MMNNKDDDYFAQIYNEHTEFLLKKEKQYTSELSQEQSKKLASEAETLLAKIRESGRSIVDRSQRLLLESYAGSLGLFIYELTNDYPNTSLKACDSKFGDWGNAPDVSVFFGRNNELDTLKRWIVKERCRLVVILGIGGIGKTQLSVKLGKGGIGKTDLSLKVAQGIQEEFEYVIWRSLLAAPPITQILADLIKFVSNNQETNLPTTAESQISKLLSYLSKHRCLLILDNVESILQGEERPGQYRKGYEDYGQLFKQVGNLSHQSCLILTSREKPQELEEITSEKNNTHVRCLELEGLDYSSGQNIFKQIGDFSGSDEEWRKLIKFYNGNPLALKLTAKHIKEEFSSNISKFLEADKPVFDNLRELLDWHFKRLSNEEKKIIYWLAINLREPLSIQGLQEDILLEEAKERVPSTLQSLQRRLPLQRSVAGFTLQPVLIEYMTDQLIEQVCEEIKTKELKLFNSHALILATAKDYVREAQIRLILKPVADSLLGTLGSERSIEAQLTQILLMVRERSPLKPGYAAGNILNLLIHLNTKKDEEPVLSEYDFSKLTIRQAYLQDVSLHNFNFANANLDKCIFKETFGNVGSITFSPDGELLAIGDTSNDIHLWQVKNSNKLYTYQERHIGFVSSVLFSPNGQILASGGEDKTVRLWKVPGDCLKTLEGHTDFVRSVAFSPDGQIVASGSDDQTVRLWDVSTGKCLKTLKGHTDFVRSVAFSPDGQLLASGSAKYVWLWDLNTSKCIKILEGHTDFVRSVAFSPDGRILASSGVDNKVLIWDVSTGKCLKTLKEHTNWVWSIAFCPDSQILASVSLDQTIRLWNVHTGECLETVVEAHKKGILSVTFSSNGKILASAGQDDIINLWEKRPCEKRTNKYLKLEKSLKLLRPYEKTNIKGVSGLTKTQKATLKALGALD